MSDADRRSWVQAPRISHWVYEAVPGQINACDGDGHVLMAIATDPQFGSRLAAAFGSTVMARPVEWPAIGVRHPAPAFPF